MNKVILTKGLPASGKTTWAKSIIDKESGKWLRVNKDELRLMLHNGKWSKENEEFILQMRDYAITIGMIEKFNVIVDDTNLHPKHEINIQKMIRSHNELLGGSDLIQYELEIKDFTDVPLSECLARDRVRPNKVGDKVIRGMYRQFLQKDAPKPSYDPKLPNAVWVDIDGTLALFGDKNPYDRNYLEDEVNTPVVNLVEQQRLLGNKIIIVSGRKDIYKEQTVEWLKKNNIIYDEIHMRKTQSAGAPEPKDDLVKKEIYESHIKGKYNILFCLDDRNRVVDMLRGLGLTVLQVAEGDF